MAERFDQALPRLDDARRLLDTGELFKRKVQPKLPGNLDRYRKPKVAFVHEDLLHAALQSDDIELGRDVIGGIIDSAGVPIRSAAEGDARITEQLQRFDFIATHLEQSRNLDLREYALSAVFALGSEVTSGLQGIDRTNIERAVATIGSAFPELLRKLGQVPPDLADPRILARLLEESIREADLDTSMEPMITLSGLLLRDAFAKSRFGEPGYADPLTFEHNRIEGLIEARSNTVRGIFLNRPIDGSRVTGLRGTLLKGLAQGLSKIGDIDNTEVSKILFDKAHPRHREAMLLAKKYMLVATPEEQATYFLNFAADPTDSGKPLDRGKFNLLRNDAAAKERVQMLMGMYEQAYGSAGPHNLLMARSNAERGVLYGEPLVPTVELVPKPHTFSYVKVNERLVLRASPDITTAEASGERLHLPEVSPEQMRALEQMNKKLLADVKESSVALSDANYFINADTELIVRPIKTDGGVEYRLLVLNDDAALEVYLDSDFNFTTPLEDVSSSIILRTATAALMHDQLAVQRIVAGEGKVSRPGNTSTEQDSQPVTKPEHVRQVGSFIVFPEGDEPFDEHTTILVRPTAAKDELTLTLDRRPHWADLAPQLTVQARTQALEEFAKELTFNAKDEAIALLTKAVQRDQAHTVSMRKIVEDLLQQELRGKKVLPAEFPAARAIERLTELEAIYYQRDLSTYVGYTNEFPNLLDAEPAIADGPLPNVANMPKRLENDRLKMQELGVHYAVPDRQRPTQTYRPFSRYERTATIKGAYTRIGKLTAVQGSSAIEAVMNVLH